jgi:broad specificity phosphatase PhoE
MERFVKIKSLMMKKPVKGRVILLRHGSTSLNNTDKSEDRIRGWIDVPLNPHGVQEAKDAGEKLSNLHVHTIYSSDLKRAKETADIVSKYLGNPPIIVSTALRPWNLGDLQGEKTSVVTPLMEKYIKDSTLSPTNGESFNTFHHRYLTALEKIVEQAESTGETILVVTHYRNAKLADAWDKAGLPRDLHFDLKTMLEDNVNPAETLELKLQKS